MDRNDSEAPVTETVDMLMRAYQGGWQPKTPEDEAMLAAVDAELESERARLEAELAALLRFKAMQDRLRPAPTA